MDLANLLQQATDARARRIVLVPGRPAVFRDDEGARPTGVVLDVADIKALLKSALPGEMLREMRWGSETPYQLEVDGRSWDLLIVLTEEKELRVEITCRTRPPRRRRGAGHSDLPPARVFTERVPSPGGRIGGASLSPAQPFASAIGYARAGAGGGNGGGSGGPGLAAAAVAAGPQAAASPASLRPQVQIAARDLSTPDLIVRNSVANEPDYELPASLAAPSSVADAAQPARASAAPAAPAAPVAAAGPVEEPRALEVLAPAAERGVGLVYASAEGARERAASLLRAAGYGVQAASRAVDLVEALRYTSFPVVLLSPAGALRDDPVFVGLNELPMARRRTLFVVLLAAAGEAHDRRAAFAQSVDLCLPPGAADDQAARLLSALALWEGETHELREALAANGRM